MQMEPVALQGSVTTSRWQLFLNCSDSHLVLCPCTITSSHTKKLFYHLSLSEGKFPNLFLLILSFDKERDFILLLGRVSIFTIYWIPSKSQVGFRILIKAFHTPWTRFCHLFRGCLANVRSILVTISSQ